MRLEPVISFDASMNTVDIGATPDGHRMNMELNGRTRPGSQIEGLISGVDLLRLRPDGVADLEVLVTLATPEQNIVAVRASGLATLADDGTASGLLTVRFETGENRLSWLNTCVGVASTTANMTTGSLSVDGFVLRN